MSKEKDKSFTLVKAIPSMVTLLGLCIGLSAIRFAMDGSFVKATSFLLIAGFIDGVDGRLARFLNSSSEFGAQLDSLVDFVNFGVVPGFIVYAWINLYGNIVGFDWALVLFFAISMAIRLARFNVSLDKDVENPILEKYFFAGIPAPCGAALAMLPMIFSYEFGDDYFFTKPVFVISYMVVLALLVASTVPTISIKKIPIRNEYFYPTLIVLGSIAIGLVVTPWMTLVCIGAIYLASILVTIIAYLKIKYSK
jgi:CDP-diacylglycerol--serine O-phosphatidyltransferase